MFLCQDGPLHVPDPHVHPASHVGADAGAAVRDAAEAPQSEEPLSLEMQRKRGEVVAVIGRTYFFRTMEDALIPKQLQTLYKLFTNCLNNPKVTK